jgi:formyl-CoA transferase
MVAESGSYRGTGNPVKLSRTPASLRSTPPAFGEATREVLAEAGYTAAEIDVLFSSGAALETPRKAAAE